MNKMCYVTLVIMAFIIIFFGFFLAFIPLNPKLPDSMITYDQETCAECDSKGELCRTIFTLEKGNRLDYRYICYNCFDGMSENYEAHAILVYLER